MKRTRVLIHVWSDVLVFGVLAGAPFWCPMTQMHWIKVRCDDGSVRTSPIEEVI